MVEHNNPTQETYRLAPFGVIRGSDGANIVGPDRTNPDWVAFDEWKNAGGVPYQPAPGPTLEDAKIAKIQELEGYCDQEILTGFPSSALGEEHHYDSGIVDQINLLGAVMLGKPTPYKCLKKGETDKQWQVHTPPQMQQVVADGATYRMVILQKFTEMKSLVHSQTTHDGVASVEW